MKVTYFQQYSSKVPKYQCGFCSYATNVATHIQDHQRTHTGEKPFKCSVCSQTFSQKSSLKTHFRRHTGERPFHCRACKKDFTHKVTLQKHKCMPSEL